MRRIAFAANNGSPANPFGEINAVSGDITFGSGTSGSSSPPAGFQNNGVVIDTSVVKVAAISMNGNNVGITINSHTGHRYQLQYSPTLEGGSFTNIGAPQSGRTGTTLLLTDPNATASKGF